MTLTTPILQVSCTRCVQKHHRTLNIMFILLKILFSLSLSSIHVFFYGPDFIPLYPARRSQANLATKPAAVAPAYSKRKMTGQLELSSQSKLSFAENRGELSKQEPEALGQNRMLDKGAVFPKFLSFLFFGVFVLIKFHNFMICEHYCNLKN